MNKLKIVFNQTLMISTGILFCVGISNLFGHLAYGYESLEWEWYTPLSFVLAGFLCSLPTLILFSIGEKTGKTVIIIGKTVHFIVEGATVSLCGYFFGWFKSFREYLPILVMYVLIYAFVWIAMTWIYKKEDALINEALKGVRDEE